jgi:NTP pyrophosphatase (non-canonical NTP hydrolase)
MPVLSSVEVRVQVVAFAGAMERKLKENDHKGGWLHLNNGTIMARIEQELQELREALAAKDPLRIGREAADVGNFLMMLCQNNRALGTAGNDAPCRSLDGAVR